MAPSPAAGRQQASAPKTPTKLGRKPGNTPQKLGQSAAKGAQSAKSTPKPKAPDASQASEKAEKPKEAAKDAGEDAQKNVELKDDENDDEDEGQMSKVSQAGEQGKEGLEEAAPEPVQDDDDDDNDDNDAVEGATQQAEDGADDAQEEGEDVADDATEKAGQAGESADETQDDNDEQEGQESGGLLSGAKGLAGKAQGLAEKQDPKKAAQDPKQAAEDVKDDAEETAEGAAEEGQKVAGETTDEAGEAADDAKDTAEDAEDQAEDTAEDGQEQVEGATEDAEDQAEGATEGAEDQVNGVEDDAEDAADDAQDEGEDEDQEEGAEGSSSLGDLSVLKGLEVGGDGNIVDAEGNPIGKLSEGDAEDLEGYPIGDNGEILDDDGDLVGRCELLPAAIKKQFQEAKENGEELPEGAEEYLDEDENDEDQEDDDEEGEDDEDDNLPGLSIMEGLTCQVDGLIYDSEGNTIGKVTEGDPSELQNATLNGKGEFIDEDGNVVGYADIHEDAADLVEQGIYEPRAATETAEGVAEQPEEAGDDAGAEAGDAAEDAADRAEDAADNAEDAADDAEEKAEGIEDELPGIEALEGKELNEAGEIVGSDGGVLGHIEDEEIRQKIADGEIDPETLNINEEGQVVDEDGNILSATELAEGAAEKLGGGLAKQYDVRILGDRKVNKKGKVLDDDGEEIGQLTEGDPAKCAGQKINEKGEVVNKKGEVIGKVGITEGEAAETATKELLEELGELPQENDTPGIETLEGLKVNKTGKVLNEDGEEIGELSEGELAQCAGKKINEKGEVLDKDGKTVLGKVRTLSLQPEEEEEAEEEETPEEELAEGEEEGEGEEEEEGDGLPPLSILDGLPVNKAGKLLDSNGNIVGELVEGDAKKLSKSGITADAEGQFWDNKGKVIGRAQTVPQEEGEEESPFAGLEGLKVVENGYVADENGNIVGVVTEGDAKKLIGRAVDEDGDIIDKKGSVVGHADRYEEEEAPEEEEEGDGLPPLSILDGLPVNKAGKLLDSNGNIIGELIEGDAKKLSKSGLTADAEGQFWDNKGKVIGRAQTVPQEEGEEESPFAGLEGLKVVENGYVADENGNIVGVVTEGDAKKLIGRAVDEDGDIIDKKGSVVGHADRYEEEEAPEEEEEAPADLSFLQGKPVNKAGVVIGDEGTPIARLAEGKPKECAGRKLDDQGQLWNDQGQIIGRVELIPEEERESKPEGPFAGLEDLRVIEGGKVADEDGNVVGEIVEGNPKRLIGLAVDEDGDIVDKYGNVKGHAEPLPDEEEEEEVDNSILLNKELNKQGYVVDESGIPFGRLVEGNVKELAGRRCDENGYIYGDTGKVVGRCEVLPENERVSRPEGPFAGHEGLRVVKDGKVEDQDGNVVGEITEGNAKKLVGLAVDEDGDIIDKYGNVKGHADPWEEEEEEEVDLSALAGTTINKTGNAVDGNGTIIGRIVEGDVGTLVGKKVDGQGQVWDNAGNVVGRCELVFGEDTSPEGPFAGFEGLEINKDGTITTQGGDIIGRVTEGDIKKLLGHGVEEDGTIIDKNGNQIGAAERWEPEEKERTANPMSGMRVNKEGEVRDQNGDLMGRLTDGALGHCVGQEIDDNGNVVDQDGNKIGEVTLLENIDEETYEGPTEEELAEAAKREEEREIADKMNTICQQTLERVQPICKQIKEHMDKADRTPKEELDEEELVNNVKPLIEEAGRHLQECNGSLRGLDPDGKIAAQAKGRQGTGEATPEEHRLAESLKELTTTVVTTIDDAKKKLNDMPHAKKKLNPLWGLMTQPLFQILAAVGLLLAGVLGLVGQLLNGLGLGGLVNGLLGGLGVNKLLGAFGLGGDDKKKGDKKKGGSALSSLPIVGGMLGGKKD